MKPRWRHVLSCSSALHGEVAELRADLVLETSRDAYFPVRKVIDLIKKMQAELTQDAANVRVIMDKMDCGCVNRKEKMEPATQDASERLNKNQLTENDDIEEKQKELEGVVNPMMTNVQLAGKDEFEVKHKELEGVVNPMTTKMCRAAGGGGDFSEEAGW